ncbi:MAG: hypothetical protein R3C56_09895 [Pirellulaceae bacterium]
MNGLIGVHRGLATNVWPIVPSSCFYFELSLPTLPDSPQSLAELADNPQSYHVVVARERLPLA